MEILHIYGTNGAEISTVDLTPCGKTLLVGLVGGRLEISEAAAPGTEIVAALVRNEDGWLLASSKPDVPIVAGPKAEPDMQLMPGVVCAIAGYSFRLERDQASAGCMLLWRYERSNVVADAVVAGRNVVAVNNAVGTPSVNPALAGDVLFEFFPSADGIDVVSGTGEKRQRLTISAGTLFAVGGFEAMYLSSADAEQAMKTSAPFRWPSRKPLRELMIGVGVLVALLFVCCVMKLVEGHYRSELATPMGAAVSEPMYDHTPYQDSSDFGADYEVKFYRSLPSILGAETQPLASDLVRTGQMPNFTNDTAVSRRVQFLNDVTEIQKIVRSGRWEELEPKLKGVDREMFTLSDADDFYREAEELLTALTKTFPSYVRAYVNGGTDLGVITGNYRRKFEELRKGNRFMTGVTLGREERLSEERAAAVKAFVAERDRARSVKMLTVEQTMTLTDSYLALADALSDAYYQDIVVICRKQITDLVDRLSTEVIKTAEATGDSSVLARLGPLAELGAMMDMPEERVADWRRRAQVAKKELMVRYQKLYQEYRLKAGNDRAAALKALDEMLEIGFADSPYYGWAVREKEKIERK